MKICDKCIDRYAKANRLKIVLPIPENKTDKQLNRYLMNRYSFYIDLDKDSEYELCLFYNYDLRSLFGNVEEYFTNPIALDISPRYYASGWENTHFKKLMEDSESVKIL